MFAKYYSIFCLKHANRLKPPPPRNSAVGMQLCPGVGPISITHLFIQGEFMSFSSRAFLDVEDAELVICFIILSIRAGLVCCEGHVFMRIWCEVTQATC